MTQALACFNDHGVVLATDSLATRFTGTKQADFFHVEKLYALGAFSAVLSGGAGLSVPLSLALRHEISRRRGLQDVEQIVEFALPFLSRAYGRYLDKHGPEPEGYRRLYFIIAGYSPQRPPPGFALFLLGSEENELPLRLMTAANLVVMPRNLGMEMRLLKALSTQASLSDLLALAKDFLVKMAAAKEEVGPPFYFATITSRGYQPVIL